jgi:NAD+ synthase
MINIYDQSAEFPGLVVGTGNKTESLLGYSTIHGDGAFDFNPLADLYKAQVRQLAEAMGVPQVILEKAPSADLWVGQTDEEELGFTYDEMDQLLYLLVEEKFSHGECVKAGFSEDFVAGIISRVKHYRYKSILPLAGSVGQYPLSELEQLSTFSK